MTLSMETFDNYVKAIIDLYKSQIGLNLLPSNASHPKGPITSALIKNWSIKTDQRRRSEYHERGHHSLADGYTLQQFQSMTRHLITENTNSL